MLPACAWSRSTAADRGPVWDRRIARSGESGGRRVNRIRQSSRWIGTCRERRRHVDSRVAELALELGLRGSDEGGEIRRIHTDTIKIQSERIAQARVEHAFPAAVRTVSHRRHRLALKRRHADGVLVRILDERVLDAAVQVLRLFVDRPLHDLIGLEHRIDGHERAGQGTALRRIRTQDRAALRIGQELRMEFLDVGQRLLSDLVLDRFVIPRQDADHVALGGIDPVVVTSQPVPDVDLALHRVLRERVGRNARFPQFKDQLGGRFFRGHPFCFHVPVTDIAEAGHHDHPGAVFGSELILLPLHVLDGQNR